MAFNLKSFLRRLSPGVMQEYVGFGTLGPEGFSTVLVPG